MMFISYRFLQKSFTGIIRYTIQALFELQSMVTKSCMDSCPCPSCRCSTQQLLQLEILNIKRFASWNGFPSWICDKLINTCSTSQSSKTTPGGKEPEPTIHWAERQFPSTKLHQKDFPLTQTAGEIHEPMGNHRMQLFHFSKRSYAETLQKLNRV